VSIDHGSALAHQILPSLIKELGAGAPKY